MGYGNVLYVAGLRKLPHLNFKIGYNTRVCSYSNHYGQQLTEGVCFMKLEYNAEPFARVVGYHAVVVVMWFQI